MMEINKILHSIGCCKACILRYIGSKNPTFYADADNAFKKLDTSVTEPAGDVEEAESSRGAESPGSDGEPSSKRRKHNPCVCCLGLLQKESWPDMLETIKQIVEEKNYDSETFACALTSPMSLFLREHSINLYLQERLPKWKPDNLTSLKEAWKWSFGVKMAEAIGKTMNSGATCQYMIKANMTYAQDTQELESLQRMCPRVFEERSRAHRKFRGEVFTRKGVEGLLAEVAPEVFRLHFRCPPDVPEQGARCEGAECLHQPIYLAGRYSKFSRELCQTPWILDGKRMMESSIQDIIFKPVAELYNIPPEEAGNRLKFLSSGREDVDVRCLGLGRPFAVEISDPKGARLDSPSLAALTRIMCRDPSLIQVRDLQIVSREELTILKMGEETKSKTYLALCVKIESENTISECDHNSGGSTTTTLENGTEKNGVNSKSLSRIMQEDLDRLNTFTNDDNGIIKIQQKTPLRVLHRRPLLIRERKILKMEAEFVKDKPNLFIVEMTTEAGTYIKEFVHGDFGRTKPSLTDILGFKVDILALDVKSVNLDWPKTVELHCT